mmetsp:Transcript_15331/g.36190  ORF Transcript_15331/g.36190 Transcript_15331/m.36190 type:complete len:584 (-) Transcript_15331:73-1824(-)
MGEPPPSAAPVTLVRPLDLIDGDLQTPSELAQVGENECNWLIDPNTGRHLYRIRETSEENVQRALNAAWRLHKRRIWSNMEPFKRAELLECVATEMSKAELEEQAALNDAINTGVIAEITRCIIPSISAVFRDVAARCRQQKDLSFDGVHGDVKAHQISWGPTLILAPWNVPGGSIAPKVATALALGAVVILKPSPFAAAIGAFIATAFRRASNTLRLPPAILQVINGSETIGARLVEDPRVRCVQFIGGVRGGRSVAVTCAGQFKPYMLELGGNNPMIVFPDSNLEDVADAVVMHLTVLNGQWCCGLGRLIVHELVHDELLEKVLNRLENLKLGHSLDPTSQMGPISNKRNLAALTRSLNTLKELGGTLHSRSQLPQELPEYTVIVKDHETDGDTPPVTCSCAAEGGLFIAPTLVTGVDVDDVAEIELFGPVCTVHRFRSDMDAVQLANNVRGMILAVVFSGDKTRAAAIGQQLETGMVMINGVGFGYEIKEEDPAVAAPASAQVEREPRVSFWGWAGSGTDGPFSAMANFFSGCRVVGVNGTMRPADTTAQDHGRGSTRGEGLQSSRDKMRQSLYHRLRII